MKTNNRITGPRHLDARTPEGRAYRKKIGKKAFAMARRTEGPPKTHRGRALLFPKVVANGQAEDTARFGLRDTNRYQVMTTAELAEEVKTQEKKLALLRDLHRMRAGMDRAMSIILDGGTAAEATAALDLPATPAKKVG